MSCFFSTAVTHVDAACVYLCPAIPSCQGKERLGVGWFTWLMLLVAWACFCRGCWDAGGRVPAYPDPSLVHFAEQTPWLPPHPDCLFRPLQLHVPHLPAAPLLAVTTLLPRQGWYLFGRLLGQVGLGTHYSPHPCQPLPEVHQSASLHRKEPLTHTQSSRCSLP